MSKERIKAPELAAGLEWFNTFEPVSMERQRGKVVLLDFWTYSCLSSMHTQPDLRYLEDKYSDKLLVIGIHSPKFPNERISENVQKAINREHIRHPVVSDPSFKTWKQYGIRVWPTLIFIDPDGFVIGALSGEGRRGQLEKLIGQFLRKASLSYNMPAESVRLESKPEVKSYLHFPGKIVASEHNLYISDSGHNRIVVTNHYGRVSRVYGNNSPGLLDGFTESAAFNHPHGMVKVKDYLYVADTGNHAIRRISLISGEVQTIAGTGQQGRIEDKPYADPLAVSLNSPWDLAYDGTCLYIAMAGQNQVWRLHLTSNMLECFVGSGQKGLTDGSAKKSALAQPSGLALGGNALFVAEAETSAIRIIRLPDGKTNTLVGEGLFEFGDQDGSGKEVRLQHPMDVAYSPSDKIIYIADTFNHKIKIMYIQSRTVSSLECKGLNEPSGIAVQGNSLWIANTNEHSIGRLDLASGLYGKLEINEPILEF
ncbi:MAG TPA: redoxin domain-containing protein [Gammaproteobacteria bacterium]|nr:redoxin domain-containing protein [Gammaproteobacteria bacterium]